MNPQVQELLNRNAAEAAKSAAHYKEVANSIREAGETMQRYSQLLHSAASRLENTSTNPYYHLNHEAREEQAEDLLQSLRLMERIIDRWKAMKENINLLNL